MNYRYLLFYLAIFIIGLYFLVKLIKPYRNFKISDFDSPDAPGSGKFMSKEFLRKLDKIATRAGVPFIVTSGARTVSHNSAVGGVQDSAHVLGLAADLSFQSKEDEMKFAKSAYELGIRRFGIGGGVFHVDIDNGKPPAIWGYGGSPEYNPANL